MSTQSPYATRPVLRSQPHVLGRRRALKVLEGERALMVHVHAVDTTAHTPVVEGPDLPLTTTRTFTMALPVASSPNPLVYLAQRFMLNGGDVSTMLTFVRGAHDGGQLPEGFDLDACLMNHRYSLRCALKDLGYDRARNVVAYWLRYGQEAETLMKDLTKQPCDRMVDTLAEKAFVFWKTHNHEEAEALGDVMTSLA